MRLWASSTYCCMICSLAYPYEENTQFSKKACSSHGQPRKFNSSALPRKRTTRGRESFPQDAFDDLAMMDSLALNEQEGLDFRMFGFGCRGDIGIAVHERACVRVYESADESQIQCPNLRQSKCMWDWDLRVGVWQDCQMPNAADIFPKGFCSIWMHSEAVIRASDLLYSPPTPSFRNVSLGQSTLKKASISGHAGGLGKLLSQP